MLSQITLLTSIIFCALYPLSFWISRKDPLKHQFHHFHLGLPTIILGVTLPFLWMSAPTNLLKGFAVVWFLLLAALSAYYWTKEYPHAWALILPSLLGLFVFIAFQSFYTQTIDRVAAIMGVLAGLVLTLSIYTMNLGHFYLNVHGLPVSHLMRATYVFWYFTGLRLIADIVQLIFGKVMYGGEMISLLSFVIKIDGFLLLIGIFFGTLFPFVALFFANETLKLKNTQASTGILYVILTGVLIGDIACKYYYLKFGIYM